MAISKAQQAAVHKYVKNNYARIEITVKKDMKPFIEAVAKANNESVGGYVKRALQAQYKADTGNAIEL